MLVGLAEVRGRGDQVWGWWGAFVGGFRDGALEVRLC